ncbi:DUF99 family protein [Haloprofundus sp. MHR1]|uniref:endonuclease dU n=1 Tax=Haloprofundus sp. MHR1 TaxID=2572921 RepID=UPI0010BEF7F3|nr:DUF99 family protein [Haloprofundus sp. MHR1]QCJ47088.1 DUF99 family protein [Haloprofundus sp. MHR1]
MKRGARALGLAFSDGDDRSVLGGVVVRADGVVDGVAFETCAVGGTDATSAVVSLSESLAREDVRVLVLAGIAPAWFNLVDLRVLREAVSRPVLSVSFEQSPGLDDALRAQFSGEALAERRRIYRAQPPRRRVVVGDAALFVRAVGCDDDAAAELVRAFTLEGGRPEPVRVARLAARGARRWAVDPSAPGDTDDTGDGNDGADDETTES